VIGEGVQDDVAAAEAGAVERRTPAPGILAVRLGVVQGTRRLEHPPRMEVGCHEAAEGRVVRMPLEQFVLVNTGSPSSTATLVTVLRVMTIGSIATGSPTAAWACLSWSSGCPISKTNVS
jgi:hypothetical protein